MLPKFQYLTIDQNQAEIVVIQLDMPGRGANILDSILFAELDEAMNVLSGQSNLKGAILASKKPSIFIAGADLNSIASSLDWPDEKIVEFCEQGRRVMARFNQAPFPTVAAIHGACVGGGLELALWCDYRIASDDRRTQLGLPEVKLGLVPGWAGTVRLPRLIGFEPAAELAITGRSISAQEGLRLGMVDKVTPPSDLFDAALEWTRTEQTQASFMQRRKMLQGPVMHLSRSSNQSNQILTEQVADQSEATDGEILKLTEHETFSAVVEKLEQKIFEQQDIYPFAPQVLLKHLIKTVDQTHSEACHSESLAMAEVWGSPANRGLLNHFFLGDYNKKAISSTGFPLTSIRQVGIVGAGLMGVAIGAHCLQKGISVVLIDSDSVRSLAAQETLSSYPLALGQSIVVPSNDDYSQLAESDLIIETVVENFAIKSAVLQAIETAVGGEKTIASNTSAIEISRLAGVLKHPRRFCGIHFCHPQLMALVELIRGAQTNDSTLGTALSFIKQLAKTPVILNDGPGFVVNRLLAAMINQAIQLLLEGNSAESIDQSMRDFGFLGGPFEIIDTIGVETCMYAGHEMWKAGVTCVSLSPLLPKLAKMGRMGRKTGMGVYRYADESSRGSVDPQFAAIVAPYVRTDSKQAIEWCPVVCNKQQGLSPIVVSILKAMIAEADNVLREKIANDIRDIDLCVIHGLGFPQHQGGLLFWSDQVGLSEQFHAGRKYYQ